MYVLAGYSVKISHKHSLLEQDTFLFYFPVCRGIETNVNNVVYEVGISPLTLPYPGRILSPKVTERFIVNDSEKEILLEGLNVVCSQRQTICCLYPKLGGTIESANQLRFEICPPEMCHHSFYDLMSFYCTFNL